MVSIKTLVRALDIKIIHTPGHTPGSICILIQNHLFAGDTLFVGDTGRTDLPGGDLHTLLKSLENKIITLPPETIVYPGHDYGETHNLKPSPRNTNSGRQILLH